MALPASYNTVQVRGKYVDLDGTPVPGRVTFTPAVVAMKAATEKTTVIGKPISVELVGGEFAVLLPATDDPDINPVGFTYRVVEKFTGLPGRTFDMAVPIALAGPGIDIALVAPLVASGGVTRPYTLSDLGGIDLDDAVTGSILRRQPDGSWAAVVLPFVTTADIADVVRLEQIASAPEMIVVGTIDRDANGAALSAGVVWPDGTPGVYTATVLSAAHPGAVDSYSVTYGAPAARTYVQPTVTRNSDGAVTFRPAIEVI